MRWKNGRYLFSERVLLGHRELTIAARSGENVKIMPLQSNNIPKKLLTIRKFCDRIELRIEMEEIRRQITRFHLLLHIDIRLSVCIVLPSFRGNEKVKSSNSGSASA